MGDILDTLQASLLPQDGLLTISAATLAPSPFASFIGGMPGASLTLGGVSATGGTISDGPLAGERTLAIVGNVASLPLPGRNESLTELEVVVTATAAIGATALSTAALSVTAASLVLATSSGDLTLALSGQTTTSSAPVLSLSGSASGTTLDANDAASIVTQGVETALVPTSVEPVAAALFAQMTVQSATVTLATAPLANTSIGLTLEVGTWDVLGFEQFALTQGLLVVNGTCGPMTAVSAALSTQLAIDISGTQTTVGVVLDLGGSVWTLAFTPPADSLDALGVLAGLSAGSVASWLSKIAAADPQLRDVVVTFDPSSSSYLQAVTVGLSATWLGATFELGLQLPALALSVMMPENPDDPAHQTDVSFSAVLAGLGAIAPAWLGSELSLASDVELTGLTVVISPSAFDVALVVQAAANMTVAGVAVAFTGLELSIGYDAANGLTAFVGGQGTLGSMVVDVSATRVAGDWVFAIALSEGVPTDLGSLLESLTTALGLAQGLPVPTDLPVSVSLVSAGISYDTATSQVELQCDAIATATILGTQQSFGATLAFDTTVTDGARTYVFDATLALSIGAARMVASYAYDSSVSDPQNLLVAAWDAEASVSVSIDDVFSAFGLSVPAELAPAFSDAALGLSGICFELDLDHDALVLGARASIGQVLDLWLVVHVGAQLGPTPPSSGHDVIVGIGLGSTSGPVTLHDVPLVGSALPDTAFGLTAACVVLSTCGAPQGGYAFPPLPGDLSPNGDDPFALINAASQNQIPLVAATTSSTTLLAAAALSTSALVQAPGALGTLGALLGTAAPPESVLLAASLVLGDAPAATFEVLFEELTFSLPLEDSGSRVVLGLDQAGLSFTVSETNIAVAVFGTLSLSFTLNQQVVTIRLTGTIDVGANAIGGALQLDLGDGQTAFPISDLGLGIAGFGLGVAIDPVALEVTLSADASIAIPATNPSADTAGIIVGVDVEGLPNLQALHLSLPTFNLGVLATLLEGSAPVAEAASWVDGYFTLSDVTLAWADQSGQKLPDNTPIDAGFMLCGGIDVLGLQAWFDLTLDLTSLTFDGLLQTSPLSIGPSGAQLHFTGTSQQVVVGTTVVVNAGGPVGAFSSTSPYLTLSAEVAVDCLGSVSTDLAIQQDSFTFDFIVAVPGLPSITVGMNASGSPLNVTGAGSIGLSSKVLENLPLPKFVIDWLDKLGDVTLFATLAIGGTFYLELEFKISVKTPLGHVHGHASVQFGDPPSDLAAVLAALLEQAIKNALP